MTLFPGSVELEEGAVELGEGVGKLAEGAGELEEGVGVKGSDILIGADMVSFVEASDALDDRNLGRTMLYILQ